MTFTGFIRMAIWSAGVTGGVSRSNRRLRWVAGAMAVMAVAARVGLAAPPTPDVVPATAPVTGPAAGSVTGGDDAGHAVGQIQLMFTGSMAPCVAHVHACDIRVGHGSPIAARYQWDFGDEGSAYNRLEGFNAAHLYDKAGTYPIELTVTDETGVVTTFRTNVVVDSDRRKTFYVAADGDDRNPGTDPAHPFHSVARAARVLEDDVAVRFRRGDTFPMSQVMVVKSRGVLIGSYGGAPAMVAPVPPAVAPPAVVPVVPAPSAPDAGAGNPNATPPATHPTSVAPDARPVLLWDGKGDGNRMLQGSPTSSDLVIDGLTFDSIYDHHTEKHDVPVAVQPYGKLTSVRNCRFLNINYGVNCESHPSGVLVQGCDAPLETGIRGYFTWISASDIVVLGNSCVNSTREHICRMADFQRVLVYGNAFANIDRSKVDKQDTAKGAIVVQKGAWATIARNTVTSGGIGVGPLGGIDGIKTDKNHLLAKDEFIVVEDNLMLPSWFEMHPGAAHVVFRNNLVRRHDGDGFILMSYDKLHPERSLDDVRVLNNTVILDGDRQGFGKFLGRGSNVVFAGNLLVAPNLVTGGNETADVFVTDHDLGSFAEIRDNVWAIPAKISNYAHGGVNYVWPAWADSKGYLTPAQWAAQPQVHDDAFRTVTVDERGCPVGDGAAIARPVAGISVDLYGNPRDPAHPVAGAVVPTTQPAANR